MIIVNENYIKEYEEMSLCDFADELVEPLCIIKKDLTKAIYIRYAEERDKNDELEKENARLKDKLKDIKKILDADCCVENIYQAMCQYLNIHDFELNLEDYLKEN